VIIEYEQTTQDNGEEFLLELLELAVGYLVLVEESFHADIEPFTEIIHQIIIDVTLQNFLRLHTVNRGRSKVVIDRDKLLFLVVSKLRHINLFLDVVEELWKDV